MKLIPTIVLLCTSSSLVVGQAAAPLSNTYDEKSKRAISGQMMINSRAAGPGSVLLNNGDEIKGVVIFEGEGRVKVTSGKDVRTFGSDQVVALEYFDSLKSKQRVYLSLDVDWPEEDLVDMEFLEVVRQYSDFAVVKQEDPMEATQHTKRRYNRADPTSVNSTLVSRTDKVVLEKTATIYLVKYNEKARPYLRVTFKDTNKISGMGLNRTKEKGKILDRKLLQTFFGPQFEKIQSVRYSNNLDLDDEGDLVAIFDKIWGK